MRILRRYLQKNKSMKISYILLILFLSCSNSIAQISENIDRYVEPLVSNQDFAGVILVSKNDTIIHLKGYGKGNIEWQQPNTGKSVFHIASLTKQFTAAAILKAQELGLLSIQDSIGSYVPNVYSGKEITIKHLLSHGSGIPDYNDLDGYAEMSMQAVNLQNVIIWFKDEPLLFSPGSDYEYSNSNYVLAARILEIASEMSYSDFLKTHFFEPLSMHSTGNYTYEDIILYRTEGYDPAPDGVKKASYYNKSFKLGSGSLYTNAIDLYKWDRALYTESMLTESSKEQLFSDYGNQYGLGWGVYQNDEVGKFVSHDGKSPGYFAYMKRYMNKDSICIIILSNINSGIMNKMKSDITNIVFNKEFTLFNTYKIIETLESLQEYTGKYDFPPKFNFTIVEKDKELYFQWMDTPFLQYLTPIGSDEFLMRSRYDYLNFKRNDQGEVVAVNYKQKKDETICQKLDE